MNSVGLYKKWSRLIINECAQVINSISEDQVNEYIQIIESAERVFFIGVGRVMLSLKMIAKRYSHLGIDCVIVGDVLEPAITENDVLVVGSGSGNTIIPVQIAKKASQLGAKIVHLGSNENGEVKEFVDLFVRIPANSRYNLKGEIVSEQAMTSLFEQSLLLFGDISSAIIIEKNEIEIEKLWQFHANLE